MSSLLLSQAVRRAYLAVLDGENSSIVFKFPINPASWTDSHGANYADHAIIGRSHPRSQWMSGKPREIAFSLDLDARNDDFALTKVGVVLRGNPIDPTNGVFGLDKSLQSSRSPVGRIDSMMAIVRFLQALVKPRLVNKSFSNESETFSAPPKVLFVWGDHFRIRSIVRDVNFTWTQHTPNLDPLKGKVSIVLHEQPIRPSSWKRHLRLGDRQNTEGPFAVEV